MSYERHIHQLASSNSPVPSLIASFQAPTSITLVTDFAPCGSLWDRMCEMLPEPGLDTGKMPENEVRWWARQMVSAIAWLHGMGYAHRDIKPHNFLLLTDGRLWLTDFGSAAPARNGIVARKYCVLPAGTPDYVAPEVLKLAEDAMVEAAQSADESMDRTIRPSDLEELVVARSDAVRDGGRPGTLLVAVHRRHVRAYHPLRCADARPPVASHQKPALRVSYRIKHKLTADS